MPSISDLLYALSDWLRATPLVEFALWISNQELSLMLGRHFLTIQILQTIHILAIAAAFSSVLMINLRILGVSGESRTFERVAQRYVPWIWWSTAVLVASGLVLVVSEPVRELINPIFWIKMALIVGLVLVSVWFQAFARRNGTRWEVSGDGSLAIRTGAAGILVLWALIMTAGRWIAYVPV